MRKTLLVLALLIGVLLIAGSSGNFRAYTTTRTATLGVVNGENSYVAFSCSPAVEVMAGTNVSFTLVGVKNLMDVPITIHVEADFSGLPDGATGDVAEPNAGLQPGQSVNFTASVAVDRFSDGGLYEIPVTIYATWDGGSAKIEACSVVLNVTTEEFVIEKRLISDNGVFPVNTYQVWVMEVRVKNNGDAGDFVVIDCMNSVLFHLRFVHVSAGTSYQSFERIRWYVHLEHGESAVLRMTVSNRLFCGRYSTRWIKDYVLNPGACVFLREHECGSCPHLHEDRCLAKSNPIIVTAVGGS